MISASDAQRLVGWSTAVKVLREQPAWRWALGWGPETFRAVYRLYRTQGAAAFVGYDRVADHAHDLPLELLVTLGALGTAAFVYLARSLWRDGDHEARAALLGLGVMSLVEPLFAPPALLLFALLGSRREDLVAGRDVRRPVGVALALAAALVWSADQRGRSIWLHPRESEACQYELAGALGRGNYAAAGRWLDCVKRADPAHRPMQEQASALSARLGAR